MQLFHTAFGLRPWVLLSSIFISAFLIPLACYFQFSQHCRVSRTWVSDHSRSTALPSVQFSSVAQLCPTLLRPHELQHARPPCPSPTPAVHSDSRPSSQWCHPAISSSVVLFSSCPQSLPASESFPMSQLFAWGDKNIGVSDLASLLSKNTQDWSPLEWTRWISLQSKGLSRVFEWRLILMTSS